MSNLPDTLKAIVGRSSLLLATDELRVYECDGLPQHKSLPRGVAIIRSTDDVARVVAALSDASIPFLARGSGTGLSGGALALDAPFIIELARLNRIFDIDPVNRTVRVETGILNAEVSRRARSFGLYYSPDPSSQKACTIGGNIAENAGGIHCLRNGVTVTMLLRSRSF
jgi:FAD/FMN-containing dehydrogenases